jgi:hypothetical protein
MKNRCHIMVNVRKCEYADKYGRCSIKPDSDGFILCKKEYILFRKEDNVPNPNFKQ